MRCRPFAFAAVLAVTLPVLGQDPTAADLNEGSRLIQTSPTTYSFRWWGRAGKTYFIQQTDDLLVPWQYLPLVGTGGDGILSLGFNAPNSDKLFLRVEILSYDPYIIDSDGDGMPDAYEVLNYLDHKVANGALADFDGDGVPDREDARPKNPAVGRLSITITTPNEGGVISN